MLSRPLGALVTVLFVLVCTPPGHTAITLDPANPTANFTKEGTQSHTPGAALRLQDVSAGDFVSLFGTDLDAAPGNEIDVTATFQITSFAPNNADVGNRIVINDGASRAAIAACTIQNNVRGIGLLGQGLPADPASYPVFLPVDWQNAPVTVRLRRTAAGDAEIVEVNGVAPNPRALLPAAQCASNTRPNPSVEFGARSPEAECTVDYAAFNAAPSACAAPMAGCRAPALGGQASLSLKNDYAEGARSQIIWRWIKGSATAKADFGTPLTTTDYWLCLYDGTSAPIATFRAPAGGFCAGRPCWKEKSTGFAYVDKDPPLTPRRLQQLLLKEGAAEKAKIIVKGKGSNLYLPSIPITLPLTVQLVNGTGTCWSAVYSAPAKKNGENDARSKAFFQDKAD
jgi:hypothetical protein